MRIPPEQVLLKEDQLKLGLQIFGSYPSPLAFTGKLQDFVICVAPFFKAVVVQHRQLHMAITFCNTYVGDTLMIHERKKRISQILKST